jgi:hypothetical protein
LAFTIFCAIIATGYSQDSDFRGWARAGRKDESNCGCPSAGLFLIAGLDYLSPMVKRIQAFEMN